MVVPFGFGIGDVIALAKLVTNVISAIKQARGVSGESEQIISRLSSLHSALETVASALETRQHSALLNTCGAPRKLLASDAVNGIGFPNQQLSETASGLL